MEYLLRVVKDKNIQVLISTHSPTFVELLPEESLIVLDDLVDGVRARMEPTKSGAFHRLGQPASNKTLLLAEDSLLAAFVDSAHHKLAKEIYSITDVEAATVGASEMLSNQVKAYSLANSKVIMILD
ncbi:hypothetical protein QE250_17060, partial [Chromatiaceae bacterium AAb-1]|nr:hypothetical protein [Chromatiaceae bacterium AAb-1]